MKRRQISELLNWYSSGTLKHDEAVEKILLSFDVMQRSEQLPCERCKKLEFMIENGLGWEDMRNDCT